MLGPITRLSSGSADRSRLRPILASCSSCTAASPDGSPSLQPRIAVHRTAQCCRARAPVRGRVLPGGRVHVWQHDRCRGNVRPKSVWALTAIERLFDIVRDELGLNRTNYDLVGFSGGAQFVHRLVLFLPEARFRRAVAASAGRYAFPSWSEKFPYRLNDSPLDQTGLRQAFSRDLVVLLGDRDVTDREREPGAMAQGTTRFARGLRFFAMAADEAAALGYSCAGSFGLCPASIIPQCPWCALRSNCSVNRKKPVSASRKLSGRLLSKRT